MMQSLASRNITPIINTLAAKVFEPIRVVRVAAGGGAVQPSSSDGGPQQQQPKLRVLEIASGPGEHIVAYSKQWPQHQFTPSDLDEPSRQSIILRTAAKDSGTDAEDVSGRDYGGTGVYGGQASPAAAAAAATSTTTAASDDEEKNPEQVIVPSTTTTHNIDAPLSINSSTPVSEWGLSKEQTLVDVVIVVNLTHISPYAATEGLFAGAARVLLPGGRLFIYGPFNIEDDVFTSDGNERFDGSLRKRNETWGIRNLSAIKATASAVVSNDAGDADKVASAFKFIEYVQMPANNLSLIFERTAVLIAD